MFENDFPLKIFFVGAEASHTFQWLNRQSAIETLTFTKSHEAISKFALKPDLIIVRLEANEQSYQEFTHLLNIDPDHLVVPVIQSDMPIPEFDKIGVYDFLIENETLYQRLTFLIKNLRRLLWHKFENERLNLDLSSRYSIDNSFLGQSEVIRGLNVLILKAARSDINVSLFGENGTGKETIARIIHNHSRRKKNPFVTVKIGALPETLVESELFGHEKGAVTGAVSGRTGKFELAHKGTLFLDEIADLNTYAQAKLLQVIQEKSFTRVGGDANVHVDTRIIVATNRDLRSEVQKGNFREDLYYRLLGFPIHIPPLREREKDVLMLAQTFLNQYTSFHQLPHLTLSEEAQQKLLNYKFPGNVAELKAVMELAAVMAEGNIIKPNDINLQVANIEDPQIRDEFTLDEYIERIVSHYLDKYDHKVSIVAQKLGIGKSTLYRMIKEMEEAKQ